MNVNMSCGMPRSDSTALDHRAAPARATPAEEIGAGMKLNISRIEPHRHLRRVGGPGEDVEDLADALRLRIGQVEAPAVEALLVGDVVHRVDDEVDRHDVDAPALDADRRHPRRQSVAHLLERLEEVVRAVDLVDLAGLRVADHDARAVDPPRAPAFAAHDALGIVLGPEVGMIELLGLLEHVLAEHAVVEPRGGDRAHVVEAAGACTASANCTAWRVPSTLATCCVFGAGREVVDRGEMEEVLDLALELLAGRRRRRRASACRGRR